MSDADDTIYRATLPDVMQSPVYVVDTQTLHLVYVNRAMVKKTGAAIGQPCYRAIYQQDAPCPFCRLRDLAAAMPASDAPVIFEHFNDVDDRWYQLQETLMQWSGERVVKYSVAVDISELKAVQNDLAEAHAELSLKSRALERVAATDSLTGLFNRRQLDEKLEREASRMQRYRVPFSIILADVDHFKNVNDNYGHNVGDQILCRVANTIKNNARESDMVGRWGGEEFLVICPHTGAGGAALLAEHLRRKIASATEPSTPAITCSFGVAEYDHGEPISELVAKADIALYRAKGGGRNRVEVELLPGQEDLPPTTDPGPG